jgi:predicted nucleotide-binding protein
MKTQRIDELRDIAFKLKERAKDVSEIATAIAAIEKAAQQIGKSFCGSWLGYYSRVYYKDFAAPPCGARFDPEWGLKLGQNAVSAMGGISGSIGSWREYSTEAIAEKILDLAGNPLLDMEKSKAAFEQFKKANSVIRSIMEAQRLVQWDTYLEELLESTQSLSILDANRIASQQITRGEFLCRDQRASAEGLQIPQHIMELARMTVIRNSFSVCDNLSILLEEIALHLERIGDMGNESNKIFIGHGKSIVWRDLKDFLQEKLCLPVEEFNSSSAAGMSIVERLTEMLHVSKFAFLIMTGEDENTGGKMQARLNVIHEIGLFQGRLGFKRAIVLLEDGCEEFSNIHGLTQIRFPKGDIKARSQEIREVLVREGVIPKDRA